MRERAEERVAAMRVAMMAVEERAVERVEVARLVENVEERVR